MKNTMLLFTLIALLTACSTSNFKQTDSVTDDSMRDVSLDLTMRIKMLAGVIVKGERANAEITISGPNSLYGNGSPLFILDGNPIESYATLYGMVNSADIQRVEVLKNPVDISFYGVRGANGVIKIIMKKG